jgi:hypothetical protein
MASTIQVKRVVKNPTVDTSAFATGDQIGPLIAFDEILTADGAGSTLRAVQVIDKAKQSAALDVILYSIPVTLVGAENAAADVSDADVAAGYIGHVNIVAGDYTILNANSMANKGCELPLWNPGRPPSGTAGLVPRHRVYVQIVSRGTPTYAAGDLYIALVTTTHE